MNANSDTANQLRIAAEDIKVAVACIAGKPGALSRIRYDACFGQTPEQAIEAKANKIMELAGFRIDAKGDAILPAKR